MHKDKLKDVLECMIESRQNASDTTTQTTPQHKQTEAIICEYRLIEIVNTSLDADCLKSSYFEFLKKHFLFN